MPQPYNYMLELPSPGRNLLDSVRGGLQLSAAKEELEQARLARQQQAQLTADLGDLASNPTPAAISSMMARYPKLGEGFQRLYEVRSAEHQQARIDQASQVYAALQAGDTETAQNLLKEQAQAARNSGMEREADAAESMGRVIAKSPRTAQATAGLFLASAMGPEKFTETFTKLQSERREAQMQPAKLTEAQAKAKKAATEARFAESTAAADLASKGWDVSALITDPKVARENSRIAALQAEAARTDADLKRQLLQGKVADAQQKRDQAVRDKAAAAETIISTSDNQIATIDRLLANPGLNDVTGPIAGSEYYPSVAAGYTVPGFVFGSSPGQRAEALADLETVKSQVFMNAIVQLKQAGNGSTGLGPTSDREGERLVTSRQSLDPRQPTASIIRNLRTIRDMQKRYKDAVVKKFGAPEGVPTPAEPETPAAAPQAAPTAGADIQDLLRRHGTVQ